MSDLDAIYNFCKVSDTLGTSGQPEAEQFPAIKAAGYEMVINLATGKGAKDVVEEPEIVAGLGLKYHNIPVEWGNPTLDDLEQFFTVMDANKDKKLYVHCIANYRVSAFTMLYRVIKLGVPLAEAKALKDSVWHPDDAVPVWDAFIEQALEKYGIKA
ncbi:MAG TPA: protein tyrosine phosphatase family protein [Phototrophicaceae bacterium]|jgi:protein tyrosine phosphatase (PTP) superfamily phosphohydrolase (DUF442 family)|nr:protein tyrosine phosphatase family protein [Phototrophicaceae bacterium]